MAPTEKIILFHYSQSIYSHRVLWYLWLRNIPYDERIQPPVMPRPDLAAIDVNYRRIPIMAIGKDIYCDSRLMIAKLESLYPDSKLTPSSPAEVGIRKLLENWTIDGGIFSHSTKMIPYWGGLLQNKAFLDDRQKLMGRVRMTAEMMASNRPIGLQHLRQAFELLEETFLADGRKWILGTENPTLADIDGAWPFEWLIVDSNMKDCLPEEHISEKKYPKMYAWVHRFMAEVRKKEMEAQKPTSLDGDEMAKRIAGAALPAEPTMFINDDPLELQSGDEVEVFPSDYGQAHKDHGTVIGLTTTEVVIQNSKGLHLHFPRWNFQINKRQKRPAIPATISGEHTVPKMRLIYHPMSPFSRKVFMLAHELSLSKHMTLEKVVICPVHFPGWSDNNDDVSVYNPLTKIPCLVPDDVPDGIFDSRIICEYLQNLAPVNPKKDARYWRLHTLHACADGLMDATVLITYELRIRKERGLEFPEWLEGQKNKILRGLDRFEVAAKDGILADTLSGSASVDEIAVAVATSMAATTGYLGIDWKNGRPRLEEWMRKWEGRKSFVESMPEKEWSIGMEANSKPKI